jgi:hypothetical protein
VTKRIPILRKNPAILVPILYGILGATAITATAVTYVAATDPDFTITGAKEVDIPILRKKTLAIIAEVKGGRRPRTSGPEGYSQVSEIGRIKSAMVCPPSVKAAYMQAAHWYAMAAFVDHGNPELLAQAEEYIRKSDAESEDNKNEGQIISILEGAANGLANANNPQFQSILRVLLMLTSSGCIKRAQQFEEDYSPTGNIGWAFKKTGSTVFFPISFVGGIFTGNVPGNMNPNTFKLIRWSIIILGGAYLLNTAKGLAGGGD